MPCLLLPFVRVCVRARAFVHACLRCESVDVDSAASPCLLLPVGCVLCVGACFVCVCVIVCACVCQMDARALPFAASSLAAVVEKGEREGASGGGRESRMAKTPPSSPPTHYPLHPTPYARRPTPQLEIPTLNT